VKFAEKNVTWGYKRIQDALVKLGYTISESSVGNTLKVAGVE